MKIIRSLSVSVAALTALISLSSATTAYADTATTPNCTVATVGSTNTAGAADSRFTVQNNGTVSAQLKVTGTDCAVSVTLAVWQAPNADKGQPYSQQKLFSHNTATFNAGLHTISATLPDCYYQVDLLPGTSATATDGSPVYPKGTLLGSLHGGTQTCGGGGETPPSTPPAELPKTGKIGRAHV